MPMATTPMATSFAEAEPRRGTLAIGLAMDRRERPKALVDQDGGGGKDGLAASEVAWQ